MPRKDPNTDHLRALVEKIAREQGPVTASEITTRLGGVYNAMQVGNALAWCVANHKVIQHSSSTPNKSLYITPLSALAVKLMSVPWNKEGLDSIFT